MSTYRGKRVQAIRILEDVNADEVAVFVDCPLGSTYSRFFGDFVLIHTAKQQDLFLRYGDWLIKHDDGALNTTSDTIFRHTYETAP